MPYKQVPTAIKLPVNYSGIGFIVARWHLLHLKPIVMSLLSNHQVHILPHMWVVLPIKHTFVVLVLRESGFWAFFVSCTSYCLCLLLFNLKVLEFPFLSLPLSSCDCLNVFHLCSVLIHPPTHKHTNTNIFSFVFFRCL